MADSETRRRIRPTGDSGQKAGDSLPDPSPVADAVPKPRSRSSKDEDEQYSPWVDVLRVLTFLLLASLGLSYLLTSGESYFWGMKDRPYYLKAGWWRYHLKGPIYLTASELAAYDGHDPTKPIYLALNGTIYDVSEGRRIYGPGGSYNVFAGRDAARAFITGCFAEDSTPDLRGVEEMFLPLDDAQLDAHWTADQLERLRARERAEAEVRVREALQHWIKFYDKSDKYHRVGYVKREDGWLEKLPRRGLCAEAHRGREKRKIGGKK